jgi:hypothetical protein
MGKVKELWMAELEANPVLHERYWLNEMFHHHEPVLPDYSHPTLEFNHEKDLPIQQYQSLPNIIRRRTAVIER